MSPSSLIFVAVVASWSLYLVVHVARRREQLATARNVDRFSSQMRVLQRRAVANANVESTKRLSPTLLAVDTPSPMFTAPAAEPVVGPTERPLQGHTVIAADVPSGEALAQVRVEHTESEARRRRSLQRNRIRAAVLMVSSLAAVVTAVLTALSVVGWYVPAALVGVAVATVASMRASALRRRAARTRAAAAAHRDHERAARARRQAEHERRPEAPEMPVAQEFVAHRAEFVARDEVFDLSMLEPVAAACDTAEQPVDLLFEEHGWQPTPVPPPTYTLKAKAYRPLPPPAETSDVPVPIEVDMDEVAWDTELGQPRVRGA